MKTHTTFDESDKFRIEDECYLDDIREENTSYLGEIIDIFADSYSQRLVLKFENGYELRVNKKGPK